MTSKTRKLLHAGLIALAATLTDVGLNLQADVSWTKAAVFGLVIGSFARVLGAVLAAEALDE